MASNLESSVEDLLDSPGGRIAQDIGVHLRKRARLYALIFILGMVITFPLTKELISWLLGDAGLLPEDANIITTTPVEFILIQVRIAAGVGLFLVLLVALSEGALKAAKSEALRERLTESGLNIPKPRPAMIKVILSMLILAGLGVIYSWELLVPILLEYLQKDAASVGLETDWRLEGFVGFIVNLTIACIIGFQAPVITTLLLRTGTVERSIIIRYRRHIWFGAFVVGALFSPPDPLSLFMVAGPIVLLFELALLWDRIQTIAQ